MGCDFMLLKSCKEEDLESWEFEDEKSYAYHNPDRYQAEIKYDGERIKAIKKDGELYLVNRKLPRNKSPFYLEVAEQLQKIEGDFVIDGEMISEDDVFNKLQRRALTTNPQKQKELRAEIPVRYMVFDILSQDNKDLRAEPLSVRKERLAEVLSNCGNRIVMVSCDNIEQVYQKAKKENREGIIIKDLESNYTYTRSSNWLKCKFFKRIELTIQKYTTNPAGIRVEDKDGNVVQISGQQHEEVKEILDKGKSCDVVVQYLEKTEKGRLRNPSFVKLITQEEVVKELKEEKLWFDSLEEQYGGIEK
jgi:hypothetical protein